MGYGLVLLIGLVGGIAVGVQSPIAGAMGQRVGWVERPGQYLFSLFW